MPSVRGNPYLKILNFSQLFIADAPMKKKSKNLVLPPRRELLGNPVQKYYNFFSFNQKKNSENWYVEYSICTYATFTFFWKKFLGGIRN